MTTTAARPPAGLPVGGCDARAVVGAISGRAGVDAAGNRYASEDMSMTKRYFTSLRSMRS